MSGCSAYNVIWSRLSASLGSEPGPWPITVRGTAIAAASRSNPARARCEGLRPSDSPTPAIVAGEHGAVITYRPKNPAFRPDRRDRAPTRRLGLTRNDSVLRSKLQVYSTVGLTV